MDLKCSLAYKSKIFAFILWIDKYAAVDTQAVDKASKITEAANLPKPQPPFSSDTYILPNPNYAASLISLIGKWPA